MKLVYVDPQSDSNLGLYDYNLLKNIDCDITYCCSITYDAPILENVRYNKIFYYLRHKNFILKGLSYVWSIIKLCLVICRVRPDIVHIQWIRIWWLDYLVLSLMRPFVKEFVFTAHNVVPHNSGDTMKSKFIKYYNKVDKIIVHTNITKDELVNDFGISANKIAVIKHGILDFHWDENKVLDEINNIKSKNNIEGKLVFASLGVQSLYKGTDIIKEALLSSDILKNENVYVIIAGKGDIVSEEDFKDYNNVLVVKGYVTEETFQALLRLTDVLLFPYRRISQSGVLLTAIANNTPYVATNKGGLLEPLTVSNIAWELSDENPDTLASLMKQLIEKKESIKQMKRNVEDWEKVKKIYDWKEIGKQTYNWYNQ